MEKTKSPGPTRLRKIGIGADRLVVYHSSDCSRFGSCIARICTYWIMFVSTGPLQGPVAGGIKCNK